MSTIIDPLSLIREFHKGGKSILEIDGKITFGENSWPKTAITNFFIQKKNGPKEYYTLECILYFLKNSNLNHAEYCEQAAEKHIPTVRRLDRKELLTYLNGEISTSDSIDETAPIAIPITDEHINKEENQEQADKRYSYEVLKTLSNGDFNENEIPTDPKSLSPERLTEFRSICKQSKVLAGADRFEEALESFKKAALICRSERVVKYIEIAQGFMEMEEESNSKTINEKAENEIPSTEKNQQENVEKPFPQELSEHLNVDVINSKSIDENVTKEIFSSEQNQQEIVEKPGHELQKNAESIFTEQK